MQSVLSWFNSLGHIIVSLGYPGILIALIIEGLGLPFPGDAFLVFYGFYASQGKLNLIGVLVIGISGYLVGSTIAFILSQSWGHTLVTRLEGFGIINRASMTRTTNLIDKYGAILLIPGRFLPGIRSISSYAAGICRMDFYPFLIYTTISACMWCSLWVFLGYWFGENVKLVLHTVQSSLLYITLGVVIVGASVWFIRRKSDRT